MQSSLFEPDPLGDVLLVLRRPNLQKLIWSAPVHRAGQQYSNNNAYGDGEPELDPEDIADFDPEPESELVEPSTASDATETEDAIQPVAEDGGGAAEMDGQCPGSSVPVNENGECTEIQFRLSSRHLSLASRTFDAMLSGGWKESNDPSEQPSEIPNDRPKEEKGRTARLRYKIEAMEWDAEVFLLLMNIIHGHHRQVPASVDIETLGKFSVLVDYYDCHEITEFFVRRWMDRLSQTLPTSYGRDSTIWLSVSWVFSDAAIFEKMTELAMKESEGPLETMCLPLPSRLLSTIEQKRTESLQRILNELKELRDGLRTGREPCGCSFECSSMLLGSLIKETDRLGLGEMQSLESFGEGSVKQAKSLILELESPVWYYKRAFHPHGCNLTDMLEPIANSVWKELKGLRLEDYSIAVDTPV